MKINTQQDFISVAKKVIDGYAAYRLARLTTTGIHMNTPPLDRTYRIAISWQIGKLRHHQAFDAGGRWRLSFTSDEYFTISEPFTSGQLARMGVNFQEREI